MVLSGLSIQRLFPRAVPPILASCLLACAQGAEPNSVAGTMPEDYLPELNAILTNALQRSPEVIARDFERLVQEARIDGARAPQLPQLRGEFNYAASQTATASSSSSQSRDSGFFYSFSLNQALWHWGALKNQSDAARLSLL